MTATTYADVARYLDLPAPDGSGVVAGVSTSSDPQPDTLAFLARWDEAAARTVDGAPRTLFLVPPEAGDATPANAFVVPRPRLAFAQVTRDLLHQPPTAEVAATAYLDPGARVGRDVAIGHFTVVEDDVVIGDGCRIDSHVVLKSGTRLGRRVRIGSHTSIGGEGFGFEVADDGTPIRLGHAGGVEIGDDVEIGCQVSIAQGTIEPTRLAEQVKVDDCVFIAHNVQVGRASFVIAGAEISGSVTIGERVWVSPEATVINKVSIGDDALVGIGAVVVKDVEANTVVAGVPAKPRGARYETPPTGAAPLTN